MNFLMSPECKLSGIRTRPKSWMKQELDDENRILHDGCFTSKEEKGVGGCHKSYDDVINCFNIIIIFPQLYYFHADSQTSEESCSVSDDCKIETYFFVGDCIL